MATIDRINELRAQRATLDAEISQLIRQALKEGHRPTDLAKAIGISRARIYQIRQGVR